MHWDILSGKDMQVGSWPYLWLLLLRGCWSAISGYLPWLLLLRKAQSLFLYVSFANVWICENFSGLTVSHSIPYIGNFCDTSNCDTSFNRIFGISSDPSTASEIARFSGCRSLPAGDRKHRGGQSGGTFPGAFRNSARARHVALWCHLAKSPLEKSTSTAPSNNVLMVVIRRRIYMKRHNGKTI